MAHLLIRPSFKAGTIMEGKIADSIDSINKRHGIGNRYIERPGLKASKIKPRTVTSFEKLQLMSIPEASDNLGTSGTLGYTTLVKILDDTDFKWLDEKARLTQELTDRFTASGIPADRINALVTRELEMNKPLGRAQRTVSKNTQDIANENNLSSNQKIAEILQEVQDGKAENLAGIQAITGQIIQVLQNVQTMDNLNKNQSDLLLKAMKRMNVPETYKELGIRHRFVDIDFYNNNSGIINLLLLNKLRNIPPNIQYNHNRLVKNFDKHPTDGLPAVKLRTMVGYLHGTKTTPRLFLDLERGGLINKSMLINFAGGDPSTIASDPRFNIQPKNLK
jgi:murein DD-endopeptidase MepM/ murein hydrolase activator NlpD